jgi:hypothetical protein
VNDIDLDLHVRRAGDGFRVRSSSQAFGETETLMPAPFRDGELEGLLTIGPSALPGLCAPAAARQVGARLFDRLFVGDLRTMLSSSLSHARSRNGTLRIRLFLEEAPELADLPWEYLYAGPDPGLPIAHPFLCLSEEIALVRASGAAPEAQPLPLRGPLRILAVLSSPRDYPPLDRTREWTKLRTAMDELEQAGLVALETAPAANQALLQKRLREGGFHVLHFIGHGRSHQRSQYGMLLLEGQDGNSRPVSATFLSGLLKESRSLRLAVLQECQGTKASFGAFAGTAARLVREGMPAAVALQFPLPDASSKAWHRTLYLGLAEGWSVQDSVARARGAMLGENAAWGAAVLHDTSSDGRLFLRDAKSSQATAGAPVPDAHRSLNSAQNITFYPHVSPYSAPPRVAVHETPAPDVLPTGARPAPVIPPPARSSDAAPGSATNVRPTSHRLSPEARRQLRKELANVIDDHREIRLLCIDAGFDLGDIQFQGSAGVIWQSVLEYAEAQESRMTRLMSLILEHSPDLFAVWESLRR